MPHEHSSGYPTSTATTFIMDEDDIIKIYLLSFESRLRWKKVFNSHHIRNWYERQIILCMKSSQPKNSVNKNDGENWLEFDTDNRPDEN